MNVKAPEGRIVVSVDMQKKNSWQFESGLTLKLARGYNNFNLRQVNPVNGNVIAAKDIPIGTEILFQYNAIQETFRVYNYKPLSGEEVASDIQYYSIPSEMAYAYLEGNEWKPIKPYAFGLRVFRPYNGVLQGVESTLLKDTLYVTTGGIFGKIVRTMKACDYQCVFQDTNGREGNIIIFEHYEDQDHDREQVVLLHDDLTEQLRAGVLKIGLTPSDATTEFEYLEKTYGPFEVNHGSVIKLKERKKLLKVCQNKIQ